MQRNAYNITIMAFSTGKRPYFLGIGNGWYSAYERDIIGFDILGGMMVHAAWNNWFTNGGQNNYF